MPAYKDKEKGTWYASFYYEDWTGKKVKKLKRGFSTKRDALEWERTFLQQQTADLEMTFENFVALYAADMKGRIKENTWGTKEHILYKKLVPYLAYVELKGKFERLQTDYGQVQKANSRLSERLQEVKLENKSLRRTSADYAQLKQILGAEQIEATLNAAKRLKQSEKGCKQPQRSVDHGVR